MRGSWGERGRRAGPVALGAGIGMIFGSALGNVAGGMVLGAAVGLVLGRTALRRR